MDKNVGSPGLKFESVLNARDFGGHGTVGGRAVKPRKLFRGAQISNMSDRDRQLMNDLGVNLVVDFRYKGERTRQATERCDVFSPEFFVYHPDHDVRDENGLAPHEQFILNDIDGRESSRNYMLGSYTERPHLPGFIDLTARTLKQMAASGDTLYVHCAAGKDRTGTFAAIVLKALGVSDDDIMTDYMRTAEVAELELIMQMAAKKLEARYGRAYDPEALWPFFGVEPEYLKRSMDAIGSFDDYLSDVLGISADERDQLTAHYHA